jgi:hypothetical protein
MIEETQKIGYALTQDSLTTEHLEAQLASRALTLTVSHLEERLAAESLTTTHLKQSLNHPAAVQAQAQNAHPKNDGSPRK